MFNLQIETLQKKKDALQRDLDRYKGFVDSITKEIKVIDKAIKNLEKLGKEVNGESPVSDESTDESEVAEGDAPTA